MKICLDGANQISPCMDLYGLILTIVIILIFFGILYGLFFSRGKRNPKEV
jgi:hypothetical protein